MHVSLDRYLWAKSNPYKPLRDHMIDVGACAMAYLSCASQSGVLLKLAKWMGLPILEVAPFIAYLLSIHDIGKIFHFFVQSAPERDAMIPDAVKKEYFPYSEGVKFRHERESVRAARRIWKSCGALDQSARKTFAAVLALHHQGKGEHGGIGEARPRSGRRRRIASRRGCVRSRWDHRDTALMPTKSGIVGLLGCCLGYPRGDERLAALSRAIRVAVRADRRSGFQGF